MLLFFWYASRDADAHQSAASDQHHEMKLTWVEICVDVTLRLLVSLAQATAHLMDRKKMEMTSIVHDQWPISSSRCAGTRL